MSFEIWVHPLARRVEGEHIDFYYRGIHQNVLETVSRSDVVWTSRLMARFSDT